LGPESVSGIDGAHSKMVKSRIQAVERRAKYAVGITIPKTRTSLYPTREQVIKFCSVLKKTREIEKIRNLPRMTGSDYSVVLHKHDVFFSHTDRYKYFSGFGSEQDQIVFLDPDIGLEPKKCLEKHVRYSDITKILEQITDNSIISIFQHYRYKPFPDDYVQIQDLIEKGYSTAIYWHSLMFVLISNSAHSIKQVELANCKYAKNMPVKVLKL